MNTNGAVRLPSVKLLIPHPVENNAHQAVYPLADNSATEAVADDVVPAPGKPKFFFWHIEKGALHNFRRLGQRLAGTNKHLYRNGTHGHGLIRVASDGTWRLIAKAAQLAPAIVDSLPMKVAKEGKIVRELPTAAHLNAMLNSEEFLRQFPPVDQVTKAPIYSNDFSIVQPGYHDGGEGKRILFLGSKPQVADSIDTIRRFLDVMDFASNADRTNAVAAALTVLLRRHWPGQKPVVLVTATKSHAGKGTTTEFIRGAVSKADVLYESIDWPMQTQFQRQVSHDPEIGVVCLDNVRLDSAGGRARVIRSSWIESFVTTADSTLASPDAGEPIRLINKYVFVINTNDGSLSPDLLNRALPIHLAPKGDIHDRVSPIGDPKLEYLPRNRERIEAELRWMIETWRSAGSPLDHVVKHPMSLWAKTVGGILKVNQFTDFLANYQAARVFDDVIREALAILAGVKLEKALKPTEWAELVVKQGLAKTLIRSHERDTEVGRGRAIGVLLSRHLDETFETTTENKQFRVRLEGGYRRWSPGANPDQRYIFRVLEEKPLLIAE